MKRYDPDLIRIFNKVFAPTTLEPINMSALFYPSAGLDLLTPIILGLPYCTEFHFYELCPEMVIRKDQRTKAFFSILSNIVGVKIKQSYWGDMKDEHLIQFHYDGIERIVRWVHKDNKDFLNKDVMLKFHFHRGDSHGEGGSGQFWDSELMPKLIEKVPKGVRGLFITDGNPGGLCQDLKEISHEFKLPDSDRGNISGVYYFGSMFNTEKNKYQRVNWG